MELRYRFMDAEQLLHAGVDLTGYDCTQAVFALKMLSPNGGNFLRTFILNQFELHYITKPLSEIIRKLLRLLF